MNREESTRPDSRPTDANNTTRIDGRGEVTDTIETRVAQGVALLDEQLPGWVDRIDLDTLNLASPCRCILGQTWDEWSDPTDEDDRYFLHAHRLLGPAAGVVAEAEHGFNSVHYGRLMREEFAALTAEWRRVILARRGGAR